MTSVLVLLWLVHDKGYMPWYICFGIGWDFCVQYPQVRAGIQYWIN